MTGHAGPVIGRDGVGSGPRAGVMRRVISRTFLEAWGGDPGGRPGFPIEETVKRISFDGVTVAGQRRPLTGFAAFAGERSSIPEHIGVELDVAILADVEGPDNGSPKGRPRASPPRLATRCVIPRGLSTSCQRRPENETALVHETACLSREDLRIMILKIVAPASAC